jgi:hypothetical protein
MASARTQCPGCESTTAVVDLADLLYSPRVDYFRCRSCGCWWFVPKGEEGPATRAVFGHAKVATIDVTKQAS